MAIRVAITHRTEYTYDRPVALSPHVVRLRPAPHCRTPIQAYSLKVAPEKKFLNWLQDPFGNFLARLVFPERATKLTVEVDLVADLTVINPFDFFLEDYADEFPFRYPTDLARELTPYLELREQGDRLREFVATVDQRKRRTVDFLVDLNQKLHQRVAYLIRMEPGVQACETTLEKGSGSCRDSGWLLVQSLRHLGLAARFASGYIVQLTADEKPLDGPAGPSRDFTDLHAWAEVYLPGAGWVGLDPTSGLFAGEGHIPLACTPDPSSAAPVHGFCEPCESELTFHMEVQRVKEDPRVTKPFTDEQWQALNQLGAKVDDVLRARDVRLTMGGEPTFVAIDDYDSPQWNTDALGAHKRERANDLVARLRRRFAKGGVVHHGQGKWYPGEELPRWAFGVFWRRDGVPVWGQPELLADERNSYSYGPSDALRFLTHLAPRLGLTPRTITPGYEDVYYYLWREGTLPVNVDPLQADVSDMMERKRLRDLLERGLDKVAGYILPLAWRDDGEPGHWRSGPWPMRRGRVYLIPGDSPMGYRLPIDSLPIVADEWRLTSPEPSTFQARPPLRDFVGEVARRYSVFQQQGAIAGQRQQPDPEFISDLHHPDDTARTALCVEPRGGRVYVFLPPLSMLEHYLDLLSAVEATASELRMPILIEGYPPPFDWRLLRLSVTPDPGVIEVNVHPAHSWRELSEITTALYEEARLARLGTEKFLLDGRHSGSGGGNHITIGGPTPADSPLLRRPDVLRSLITYWQHHPSLSYMFSGLFIGPTSQAPRVDEARHEALFELEIAFQQMTQFQHPFPWTVDRLLRHLLIDATGNTHRAEFCIDKLYSPDSNAGRLGLLELRCFEMPPHPRMSLAQALLVRALVARFWQHPYAHPLVRWGTSLHDRFMLPHFLWEDFKEVISDLQQVGFPFQSEWFNAFHEFRFPFYGSAQMGDIELELRMAVEPWNVLGEETTALGTARYVDSSVERLQVLARGVTDGRHVLGCNGRRVPLRPTGRRGEAVAGVRYRAWQPPSALHPTIPVHAPLVFDLIDTWNKRSVGGCTYHVSHPGGLSHDCRPVNAFEAESRRITRFAPFGHTIGPMDPPAEEPTKDFPHTLDLRRR